MPVHTQMQQNLDSIGSVTGLFICTSNPIREHQPPTADPK